MNFSIPRNNESKLLLYLWKVIDLPKISEEKLLYTISFDLFLFPPDKAQTLIEDSLKNKLITKNKNSKISLSDDLEKQLKAWNNRRIEEIERNLNKKNEIVTKREKTIKSKFAPILKAISDKGSLNRAVSINDDAVNILEVNFTKGLLKAEISGSKEKPYKIEIDSTNLILIHDCHDFITRRSKEKKFCKHLIKLFLSLKETDEKSTLDFLEKITQNISNWDFSG